MSNSEDNSPFSLPQAAAEPAKHDGWERDLLEKLAFASLKEQHSISAESLLEFGFGFSQYGLSQKPDGSVPYALTPEGSTGNYYLRAHTIARRTQGLANFFTAKNWHGRHDWMAGIDADRLSYDQLFQRTTISSLREGQTLTPSTTCLTTTGWASPTPTSRNTPSTSTRCAMAGPSRAAAMATWR